MLDAVEPGFERVAAQTRAAMHIGIYSWRTFRIIRRAARPPQPRSEPMTSSLIAS